MGGHLQSGGPFNSGVLRRVRSATGPPVKSTTPRGSGRGRRPRSIKCRPQRPLGLPPTATIRRKREYQVPTLDSRLGFRIQFSSPVSPSVPHVHTHFIVRMIVPVALSHSVLRTNGTRTRCGVRLQFPSDELQSVHSHAGQSCSSEHSTRRAGPAHEHPTDPHSHQPGPGTCPPTPLPRHTS